MRVYDGSDTQAPVIAHLCGVAQHVELWSSSATLLVEFYSSDDAAAPTFDGFEARFSFQSASSAIYEEEEEEEEEDEVMEEVEDSDEEEGGWSGAATGGTVQRQSVMPGLYPPTWPTGLVRAPTTVPTSPSITTTASPSTTSKRKTG